MPHREWKLPVVLFFAMALCATAQEPVFEQAKPNLLPGGDFEGSALADHWKWNDNNGAFDVKPCAGREGGQGAALISTGTKERGKFFTLGFDVPAGADLRVSLWAKAENHLGGTWVNYEGPGGEGAGKFDLAGGTHDWIRYEHRATVPVKQAAAGAPLKFQIWFYVYGQGTLKLDDVECRVIERDAQAEAGWYAARADELARTFPKAAPEKEAKGVARYEAVVRAASTGVSGRAEFGLLATNGSQRVLRERPFLMQDLHAGIELDAARHELEGAQLLIFAHRQELKDVSIEVGALKGPGAFDAANVSAHPVVYLKNARARPWYEGRNEQALADPLLPNRTFSVAQETVQPVYLRVYVPAETAPGAYEGEVRVRTGAFEAKLPLRLRVHAATLPKRLTLRTMCVAGKADLPYQDLALQNRLGLGNIANGMSWTKPNFPAKGDGFDFSEVEKKLSYALDRGLNAFALASTPKPGKWGFPKEYSPEWKAQMTKVLKVYGAWLKEKGWLEHAYYNNIDEPGKGNWPHVKEVYTLAKAANPEVRVFSCVNTVGAVEELKAHADVFDVYVQQSDQQQANAWKARGKELWWAICIWPRERPNLFLHCPLVDARIVGWSAFKYGIDGFEYWDLTSWPKDAPKDGSWARCADGVLVADWKDEKPAVAGDGYLVYPGDEGRPINSLRFEALRDGLEDHELLVQLKRKLPNLSGEAKAEAEKLLGGAGLVENMFLYTQDAAALSRAHARVLALLDAP
ncbi:MAG: DUF4091 domain-containing protein [Planctomycetota bacterium]|nr:DUF4091 domain-containing protein [Planctomycetota bacterium]